jgi:hypothetical protein
MPFSMHDTVGSILRITSADSLQGPSLQKKALLRHLWTPPKN